MDAHRTGNTLGAIARNGGHVSNDVPTDTSTRNSPNQGINRSDRHPPVQWDSRRDFPHRSPS